MALRETRNGIMRTKSVEQSIADGAPHRPQPRPGKEPPGLVEQAGMFRRMTVAGHHPPFPPPNAEAIAFLETDDGAAFVSARGEWGSQVPLWLLDRLAARGAGDQGLDLGCGPAQVA